MKAPNRKSIAAIATLAILSSGTAVAAKESPTLKPKILVVISSKNTLKLRDGKTFPTGYYFNELTVPVRKFVDRGYDVVFANPAGNDPAVDMRSYSATYFNNDSEVYQSFRTFHDGLKGLRKPEKLSTVIRNGLDQYAAVFFPGGHAPMEDLLYDPNVGSILNHFHQAGKPTALICHGPISLISTLKNPVAFIQNLEKGDVQAASKLASGWPYAGYKMTLFSTAEERIAEASQLGGKARFYLDDAVKAAGAKVDNAKPWSSQVVRDRELITGQNPFSDEQLAEELMKALEAKKPAQAL